MAAPNQLPDLLREWRSRADGFHPTEGRRTAVSRFLFKARGERSVLKGNRPPKKVSQTEFAISGIWRRGRDSITAVSAINSDSYTSRWLQANLIFGYSFYGLPLFAKPPLKMASLVSVCAATLPTARIGSNDFEALLIEMVQFTMNVGILRRLCGTANERNCAMSTARFQNRFCPISPLDARDYNPSTEPGMVGHLSIVITDRTGPPMNQGPVTEVHLR